MNFKNRRILVTGGTGFIGSNVAIALAQSGAAVIVPTRKLRPFYYGRLSEYVQLIEADLLQKDNCDSLTANVDYIVHSGAVSFGAKFIQNNPLALINGNTIMNVQLFESAYKNKVKKIIYYGSTTGYPNTSEPVKEDEMFSGDPFEKYFSVGWMKRYTEVLLRLYAEKLKEMNCISLRLSNVYGPHDKFDPNTSHVLPSLIRKFVEKQSPLEVWGDGSESRDVIFIEDVVRATLLALDENIKGFHAINIGSGENVTVKEMISLLSAITRYSPPIEYLPNDAPMIPVRKVNIEKAKQILNFYPLISLSEGISMTIEWFNTNARFLYR